MMDHSETIQRFLVALANTKTLAGLDAVLDRAWELLPADAAVENTIVIQEMYRRREELKRKKGE